jgi:glycerol-3-phosphate cytidylyltransferase-like family protein
LDTREKIRSLDDFIARDARYAWTAVVGVFDPLTVEVVRYVASLASTDRKLLVVVSHTVNEGERGQGSDNFLSAEARARMLASLRVVDAVVIASPSAAKDAFRSARIDAHVEEGPDADRQRSEQFVQHVLDRKASAFAQRT